VPPDATNFCQVKYFFITIVPFQVFENLHTTIQTPLDTYRSVAYVVIFSTMGLLLLLFTYVAANFSNQITTNVEMLTEITGQMKIAQDKKQKEDIINSLNTHPEFSTIAG